MPHHKSCTKRLKTAEVDRHRNMAVKSLLRNQLRDFRAAGASAPELPTVYATIDRAARKGIIPRSRADRLKSRMARRVRSSAA